MNKPKEILKKAMNGETLTQDEIDTIASNAQCSKLYAQKVLNRRFRLGEDAIKTSSWQSYLYAKDVIKGPWVEGEDAIAKDSFHSLNYAENVLLSTFPKGEEAIASDGPCSLSYAKNVIRGRFEKGEKAILEYCDTQEVALYAYKYMKSRWPEAEEKIIKDPVAASNYACNFGFRWPEAEPEIIKNADCAVKYVESVIKGKWEEAEETISRSGRASLVYAKYIRERFHKGEDTIIQELAQGGYLGISTSYINEVLKHERWDKLENYIENYSGSNEDLASLIGDYCNCISGNLPESIHNRMVGLGITNSKDWSVRRYFDSLKEREDHDKLQLVKRFSLERLKEILESIPE